MEVKIGVQHASRELVVDSAESAEEVEKAVEKALTDQQPLLVLTSSKGRRVIVPTDKLGYVEVDSGTVGQVGFHSS